MKILSPKNLACAAALCCLAMLSSCTFDGSYEQLLPQTQLGVVQYTSDSSSWYILNDDNRKLLPKNAHEAKEAPKDSARVLIVFNILADESVPGYDYVVTPAYMASIRVYGVTSSSAAAIASDSSFDRPRNVENVWIGSHYLNVDYFFFYGVAPEEHEVSLLRDTATLPGEDVKLVLKHDGKGDKGEKPHQNIVSFDLESLRDAVQTDSMNISFEVECSDGAYHRSFLYRFKK